MAVGQYESSSVMRRLFPDGLPTKPVMVTADQVKQLIREVECVESTVTRLKEQIKMALGVLVVKAGQFLDRGDQPYVRIEQAIAALQCDCEGDPIDGGHTGECARYIALHGCSTCRGAKEVLKQEIRGSAGRKTEMMPCPDCGGES